MEYSAQNAVICRSPGIEPAALERYWDALDKFTFAAALQREQQAAKARDFLFAAHAPLRKSIEQNEDAMVALSKYAELHFAALKEQQTSLLSTTGRFDEITSFNLTPGLHVFVPPYDLDRNQPTAGSPVESRASRDSGEFFVNVPFEVDSDGLRVATASIVIILRPSILGTLSVRPYTKYAYEWLVAGLHLSAHTEGRLEITAIREDNRHVEDRRSVRLYDFTTESDTHSGSSDGIVHPSEFQVNFLADPTRRYLVSMTAIASGDQSGNHPILAFPSYSFFSGTITASVPWLVAELRQ